VAQVGTLIGAGPEINKNNGCTQNPQGNGGDDGFSGLHQRGPDNVSGTHALIGENTRRLHRPVAQLPVSEVDAGGYDCGSIPIIVSRSDECVGKVQWSHDPDYLAGSSNCRIFALYPLAQHNFTVQRCHHD
jgi:hypothetical protein